MYGYLNRYCNSLNLYCCIFYNVFSRDSCVCLPVSIRETAVDIVTARLYPRELDLSLVCKKLRTFFRLTDVDKSRLHVIRLPFKVAFKESREWRHYDVTTLVCYTPRSLNFSSG